jgi:Holliday junction resolvase RusA-like endonuclease
MRDWASIREQAARTFKQLRKDADDLFKAIADAEAAFNQDETIQRGTAERVRTEWVTGHDQPRLLPAKSSGPCSQGRT